MSELYLPILKKKGVKKQKMERTNFIVALALFALIASIGTVAAVPVTSFENLLGDVDGNGVVDEEDIRLMTIAQTNHLTASECAVWGVVVEEFPDVNKDGTFGFDDIQSIEYLYSMLAPGGGGGIDLTRVDTTHDYIVGDVDGNGVFDRSDLNQLLVPQRHQHWYGRWLNMLFVRFQLSMEQITRSI